MIRVLIAEDQAMVRGALASLLALEDDIEVVAEVGRGDRVLDLARALRAPTSRCSTSRCPASTGSPPPPRSRASCPGTRALILTTFGRPGYLRRAIDERRRRVPAQGRARRRELADAIRAVHAGGRVIDPALAAAAIADGVSPLTEREHEVLAAAARAGDGGRDRRAPLPLRGDGAQLPERRDPQARRPQPRRGGADRRGQGLALADPHAGRERRGALARRRG